MGHACLCDLRPAPDSPGGSNLVPEPGGSPVGVANRQIFDGYAGPGMRRQFLPNSQTNTLRTAAAGNVRGNPVAFHESWFRLRGRHLRNPIRRFSRQLVQHRGLGSIVLLEVPPESNNSSELTFKWPGGI